MSGSEAGGGATRAGPILPAPGRTVPRSGVAPHPLGKDPMMPSQLLPPPLSESMSTPGDRVAVDADGDAILHAFADLLAEGGDPASVDLALARLAHLAAGPGATRAEVWRNAGFGERRAAAWPPGPESEGGPPGVAYALRLGGREVGTLRVLLDAPGPIPSGRHRRLATLATLAAAAGLGLAGHEASAPRTYHDPATGLPDGAFLGSFLSYALALAERRQEPLSLLYIGVDRLAAIRDVLGAELAGEALRKVGRTVAGTLRSSDLIARLDDGRLVAVLPGASAGDALAVAETVRATIEATCLASTRMPALTASIGVVTRPDHAAGPAALRSAAAAALADARSGGRNRVASLPTSPPSGTPARLKVVQHVG